MPCPDHHCCKGGCYHYCSAVVCNGNHGYNADCRIPVGQVDCLDVVEYSVDSCNHDNTIQVDEGVLHVRNRCRATFKICTGPGYKEEFFPELPNNGQPTTKMTSSLNTTTLTILPSTITEQLTTEKPQTLERHNIDNHNIYVRTDNAASAVMEAELAIGIGIGVGLSVLAVIALVLCRCFYQKRTKMKRPPPGNENAPSANQTGNPMYAVDSSVENNRISSVSHRYEEVDNPSATNPVSKTFSEPKYESIKSNPVILRQGGNQTDSRITSDNSSIIYQTVADDISNQPLQHPGSDVVYSSYFREPLGSNSTSSTHYFILDPDECSNTTEVRPAQSEETDTTNTGVDINAYFVLERNNDEGKSTNDVPCTKSAKEEQ